jgi:hypothetical protein
VTDTIPALAPEHNERRPKVGDDVVNLVGGTCRGFRVSYVNDDCLEATTGDNPFTARIVRAIDKRGVTWDFDDPAASSPARCEKYGIEFVVDPALPNGTAEFRGADGKPGVRAVNIGDGPTEREQGAWELYLADTSTRKGLKRGEWSELTSWEQAAYLSMRDRAEQLFKAKSQDQIASLEDFADELATKQPDGMSERELEAWKLQDADAEIYNFARYRPWGEQSLENREKALRFRDRASQLFKAKADDRVRAVRNKLYEGMERVCEERNEARAEVERLAKERDEMARKLEGAKAEGRREAFAEGVTEAQRDIYRWSGWYGFFKWLREKAACR